MKLYDEIITSELALLDKIPFKSLAVSEQEWTDDGNNGIVLRSDMAYELGGHTLDTVTGQTLTESLELVKEDEILLYGPDLPEITKDISYARIAMIRVKKEAFVDEQKIYSAIRQMEYVRYHVHPHGFMTRISASNHREPARVSLEALRQGLDFAKVGSFYMKQYHCHPEVEAVKLIFVSLQDFDYDSLMQQVLKGEKITSMLNHILKEFKMDCGTCRLKEICDEVEGIRELHFNKK